MKKYKKLIIILFFQMIIKNKISKINKIILIMIFKIIIIFYLMMNKKIAIKIHNNKNKIMKNKAIKLSI